MALENAGFEIRDCVSHLFGSGFPKSLDVSKAIDKEAGAEREVIGKNKRSQVASEGWDRPWKQKAMKEAGSTIAEFDITAPATQAAKQWDGWGSALKPSHEVWWLARKPIEQKTLASNVLKWGTGGINISGCRVATSEKLQSSSSKLSKYRGNSYFDSSTINVPSQQHEAGRWPPNCVFSHSPDCQLVGYQNEKGYTINRWKDGAKPFGGGAGHEYEGEEIPGGLREVWKCSEDCPVRELDRQSGERKTGDLTGQPRTENKNTFSSAGNTLGAPRYHTGDTGTASRYFPCFKYCPKPSRAEREQGCESLPRKSAGECTDREDGSAGLTPRAGAGRSGGGSNHHPTVKASELMCWLIRLICPPKGTVLDPFMGSGTTGIAAHEESCSFIGIEIDPDYFRIAEARINDATKQGRLF
jgi:site-specific DNA-methyltransferase (adenine-specific)